MFGMNSERDFNKLTNQTKLFLIAEGFLKTVGLVQRKQYKAVEATHYEDQSTLWVHASVLEPELAVFVPYEARLGVDEGSGMADIRVSKNWRADHAQQWLDDPYASYIIDKFIEVYPIDLTKPIVLSAAHHSVELTSA